MTTTATTPIKATPSIHDLDYDQLMEKLENEQERVNVLEDNLERERANVKTLQRELEVANKKYLDMRCQNLRTLDTLLKEFRIAAPDAYQTIIIKTLTA